MRSRATSSSVPSCGKAWVAHTQLRVAGGLLPRPLKRFTETTARQRHGLSAVAGLLRVPPSPRSCSKPDVQGYYVALQNLLQEYLQKCFHTNFSSSRVRR